MAENSFLPIDFVNRMEQDLGPDFHAFLRSYEENKISALRFNPIKADEAAVENIADMLSGNVDWSPNGYYYDDENSSCRHPPTNHVFMALALDFMHVHIWQTAHDYICQCFGTKRLPKNF